MSRNIPSPEVMAIGQINITGNVTPATWWKHIRLPGGRPDSTAIVLLSEIVYWYRPTEVRDEHTGALIGYRQRFRGDKLQRNYQSFADQFGFSKRQVTDALKRLRDAGLITLELRNIDAPGLDGVKMYNVLFIGIMAERIAEITSLPSSPDGVRHNPPSRNTPYVKTEAGIHSDVSRGTPDVDTNTEIGKETNREIVVDGDTRPVDEQSQGSSQKTKIDYQSVLDSYHDILPEMPAVKILTDTRKKTSGRSGRNLGSRRSDGSRTCATSRHTAAGCWRTDPTARGDSGSVKTWTTC